MSDKNLIGPRVRQIREEKGWTQAHLAAELGKRGWECTADQIAEIEDRQAAVSEVQFIMFGYVLGVDHAELFPPELSKDLPRRSEP